MYWSVHAALFDKYGVLETRFELALSHAGRWKPSYDVQRLSLDINENTDNPYFDTSLSQFWLMFFESGMEPPICWKSGNEHKIIKRKAGMGSSCDHNTNFSSSFNRKEEIYSNLVLHLRQSSYWRWIKWTDLPAMFELRYHRDHFNRELFLFFCFSSTDFLSLSS